MERKTKDISVNIVYLIRRVLFGILRSPAWSKRIWNGVRLGYTETLHIQNQFELKGKFKGNHCTQSLGSIWRCNGSYRSTKIPKKKVVPLLIQLVFHLHHWTVYWYHLEQRKLQEYYNNVIVITTTIPIIIIINVIITTIDYYNPNWNILMHYHRHYHHHCHHHYHHHHYHHYHHHHYHEHFKRYKRQTLH